MLRKLIPFLVAALLLLMAVAWDNADRKSFTDQALANQISKNLDHAISSLEREAQQLEVDTLQSNWSSLHHSFYLLKNGRVKAWSKNDFAVGVSDLSGDFKLKLLHSSRDRKSVV